MTLKLNKKKKKKKKRKEKPGIKELRIDVGKKINEYLKSNLKN